MITERKRKEIMMFTTKYGLILVLSALSGGALAYLISEVIVDNVLYGDEYVFEEEDEGVNVLERTNNLDDKPDISDLTRPYMGILEGDRDVDEENEIKIIPFEEFNPDDDTYHHYAWVQYVEADATFMMTNDGSNSSEYEIDNPNELFGPNIHLHFGEKSKDEDVVYVFNKDLEKSYMIERVPIPEDQKPEEPKVKRNRRAAPEKQKEDPRNELTDDIHETDKP